MGEVIGTHKGFSAGLVGNVVHGCLEGLAAVELAHDRAAAQLTDAAGRGVHALDLEAEQANGIDGNLRAGDETGGFAGAGYGGEAGVFRLVELRSEGDGKAFSKPE